jgi:hypothetical protein
MQESPAPEPGTLGNLPVNRKLCVMAFITTCSVSWLCLGFLCCAWLAAKDATSALTCRPTSCEHSIPPYKRWGSVAELTCHLQSSTLYGIRLSHKTHRPSPTKDVGRILSTIRGPLIGEYTVQIDFLSICVQILISCR